MNPWRGTIGSLLGYVVYGLGNDSIVFYVVAQLLTASQECSDLMNVLWRAHVTYRAQVGLLGFCSMFRYDVVMEGYALDSELNLSSLDLYARLPATADKCLVQLVQLFQRVRSSRNIVTVNCKSMTKGLWVPFTIEQAVTL